MIQSRYKERVESELETKVEVRNAGTLRLVREASKRSYQEKPRHECRKRSQGRATILKQPLQFESCSNQASSDANVAALMVVCHI